MRDVNDLTEMVIKHSPRRSRRSLFGDEEAEQYLLGDGGPLLEDQVGIADLDPAFPDYNVANLFNAYFRDGDTEDDTLDYWDIENGDTELTVEDCAASPGGICLVYAPTGAVSITTKLISAPVPIGPGLDMGVVVAVGNQTSGNISIKAKIRWYDEEENLIATTEGSKKLVTKKVLRWLKIDRSKAAQAASFCSLVLEFFATGTGVVSIFGAGLYPLTPTSDVKGGPGDKTEDTPVDSPGSQGMYLYDDFNRTPGVAVTESSGTSHEIALPDGLETGDGLMVVLMWTGTSENLTFPTFHTPDWQEDESSSSWVNIENGTMWKVLDGTEGFTGSGDTFSIDHISSATSLIAIAFKVPNIDVIAGAVPWQGDFDAGDNPGSPPSYSSFQPSTGDVLWLDGDPCLRFLYAVSDAAFTGTPPTGYTTLVNANDGTLYYWLAYKEDSGSGAATPSPDPTWGTGEINSVQFAVRTDAQVSISTALAMGNILAQAVTGAPWEGDTAWESQQDVTGSADDGQWAIEANAAHAESASGSEFLSSWQRGTTWEQGLGEGPVLVGQISDATLTSYVNPTSTYEMNLPDGCDVPGRHLIAFLNTEPFHNLTTEMTAAGWDRLLSFVGSPLFVKRLGGVDGTDPTGYAEADATETITVTDDVPGSPPVLTATVILVEGLYDEGTSNPGLWWTAGSDTDASPPTIGDPTGSWVGSETLTNDILALSLIRADQAVTRETADDLFAGDEADEETGISSRMDWLVTPAAAITPDGYDTDDASPDTWTVLLRGGKYADTTVQWSVATERPEGPHNVPHMARIKFKVTDSDNGAYFTYAWRGCVEEGYDLSGGAKISYVASGTSLGCLGQAQTAITDLVEETYYYMLIDLLGDTQRVKVWPVADQMPADWDKEFAFGSGTNLYASIELDIEIVAGTGFDIDEIHIGYGTEEGASGRHYLGIANGTATAYISPLEWGPGGPKVYLDGYLTILKGFDSSDWSFEFDRAPSYGTKIEIEV